MKKAVDMLYEKGLVDIDPASLEPTHLYIRYYVPTTNDYLKLVQHDTTSFVDYPFHNENVEPKHNENADYVYAVVPISYQPFQELQYEVLEQLLFVDELNNTKMQLKQTADYSRQDLVDLIESTSEALINGTISTFSYAELKKKQKNWHPSGNLKFLETYHAANNTKATLVVPFTNVRIEIRKGLKISGTTTNAYGDFYISRKFNGKVRYHIQLKSDRIYVRKGLLKSAEIDGPKIDGPWNTTYNDNENVFYFANFMGAYEFVNNYGAYGLRPTYGANNVGGLNKNRVTISARYKVATAAVAIPYVTKILTPGIVPEIVTNLFSSYSGNNFYSEIYYNTAIHECAHVNHYNHNLIGLLQYVTSKKMRTISESYGEVMGWYFTFFRYANISGGNHSTFFYDDQTTNINEEPLYTALFIDLIDEDNQLINWNTGFNDNISGFSIIDVQNIVLNSTSWNGAITKTKQAVPSVLDSEIDNLFNYYNPEK